MLNSDKIQILTNLLDLLGPNGENWVNHVPLQDDKYCILTGIAALTGFTYDVYNEFYRIIPKNISIGYWNDTHTFTEVRDLIKQTIQLL